MMFMMHNKYVILYLSDCALRTSHNAAAIEMHLFMQTYNLFEIVGNMLDNLQQLCYYEYRKTILRGG